ncbi:hypothetical protein [Microtetraspora sp. NBRC 16547]|uniref:hypothetical protein n=1 Tax=Microtetraspora sp. NBRC 16547 TaxID=3030993 RepID=UPI0024A24951|nr:hypothetical protein [Microtetraspora sp. NBRC 16547]GLW97703.1 hypothetical protein Misp02_17900 [Microtetraspora sp. NBRC 16547]
MSAKILLPVAASVSAAYVVAAPEEPVPAGAVAELVEALPPEVELRVEEIDGTDPSLAHAIRVLSCPDCSPDVDPLVAVLLEMAKGHLRVTCTAPPGWPPSHLHWCALATDRLAELTGGARLDPRRPRVLPDPWRPGPFLTREDFAVGDWVSVGFAVGDDDRCVMRTNGLSWLGLPELRAARLTGGQLHGWLHLFNGLGHVLASALFDRPPGRRGVEISAEQVVTTADVAAAHRVSRPVRQERAVIRLRHDPRTRDLSVLAPAEFAGREADWRERVAEAMCAE